MVASIRDRLKHEKVLKSASIRNSKVQVKTAEGDGNNTESDEEGSDSSQSSFGEL